MSIKSRRLRTNIYLLFSIFFLSNCNSSPEENTSGQDNSNVYIPKVDTSVNKILKPHLDTILISDLKFHPEEIKIRKGDTIIWINKDLVTHCVTEANNKSWTSLPIPSSGSWKKVITENTAYYCAIHVVMKGRIVAE